MITNETLEKLHVKLEELRRLNKISYRKLGEVIDYSGEGINKALKKFTLSIGQINQISKKYGFLDEIKSIVVKFNELDELSSYSNSERLTEDQVKTFALIFNKHYNQLKDDPIIHNKLRALIEKAKFDELVAILPSLFESKKNYIKSDSNSSTEK
ncbi:hypothetical protein [Cochleicola gelatinilyticus]|uniref:Uncharacterized protein n=1 Tax=Cochleicola gelatinilyticus TaxID=1763537 RepID=A0A167H670_9FLAO|nr:hypothetical protein [Cochleicola gelatinilyticus]OAB78256.1 hypothetical protein ULVI_12330 [Cochleicola gelatinilyticus]